jgi:hypothetical protein
MKADLAGAGWTAAWGIDRPGVPLCYRIDREDRLVFLDEPGNDRARPSGGGAPPADRRLGHRLWNFIPDPTVREIYRQVIAEVRNGRTIHFDYGCDIAGQHREFDMTVTHRAGGEVEFRSRLRRVTSRTPLPRLASAAPEGESFLRMCSWCHALAAPGGAWLPLETALSDLGLLHGDRSWRVTHGACPTCAHRMWAELQGAADGRPDTARPAPLPWKAGVKNRRPARLDEPPVPGRTQAGAIRRVH